MYFSFGHFTPPTLPCQWSIPWWWLPPGSVAPLTCMGLLAALPEIVHYSPYWLFRSALLWVQIQEIDAFTRHRGGLKHLIFFHFSLLASIDTSSFLRLKANKSIPFLWLSVGVTNSSMRNGHPRARLRWKYMKCVCGGKFLKKK